MFSFGKKPKIKIVKDSENRNLRSYNLKEEIPQEIKPKLETDLLKIPGVDKVEIYRYKVRILKGELFSRWTRRKIDKATQEIIREGFNSVKPYPPGSKEANNDTRDCPFCGEPIKRTATSCRHCRAKVEPLE